MALLTWKSWNIVLSISTVTANATIGNKVTYNELIDKTMTIIRSCTMFHADDALLLAGEYDEFFQRSLLNDLPVALISESKSTAFEMFTLGKYSYTIYAQFSVIYLLWKLNQFIVVASSQPKLQLLLQRTRDSGWSNFQGFHILIDRKTEQRGCVNAYNFLWTAWEYDRLSTIFLCIDPIEGIVLYTFNPYSSIAPEVWRNVGRFHGRGEHPWILLKKKYDDWRTCEDLMFDKTKDLSGYEVRTNAISFEPHLQIDPTKRGLEQFTGDNSEILKIVFKKLNASLRVRVYTGSPYSLGGIGSHGTMVGMMADLATGEVDIGMNARSLYNTWKVEHTYPHGDDGLCVFTQRAGEISEFTKIMSFLSPVIHAANAVVFVIALLVLTKYQGFVKASMNIIRLMTFGAVHGLPGTNSTRIFFSSTFILYLIMNALHQSHWASFLTIPVSLPNIRTSEDLKKSGCQIYGSIFHGQELQDPELQSRFHKDTYYACKEHVLRSRCAACLGDCLHHYMRIHNEMRLYRSRKIQQNSLVFKTREDWPLLASVTQMIRRTVEGGIIEKWKEASTRKTRWAWKKRQLDKNKSFKTLKMRHVLFSFYILAGGYLLGTVAFLVEIFMGRQRIDKSSRNRKR
ncbi:uncharacterized protein [Bombus flavifrons]|uniref:uncharacterized protein n=1 Tax=Bombus flavifrons TaxID=103934 RepID=UPI003704AA75